LHSLYDCPKAFSCGNLKESKEPQLQWLEKSTQRKEPPSGNNDILRTKKSSESKEPTSKRATSFKKEKSHLKKRKELQ